MQLHLVQPVPAPELSWGTGCSSTQQTGRQGAQGCRPLSKQAGKGHGAAGWRGLNSAGRTQAGLRTSGCWVLGLGQAPPLPFVQPWDLTQGRRGVGLETLRHSTWAQPPVCPSVLVERGKEGAGREDPRELVGRAHLGVEGFLLGRVGPLSPGASFRVGWEHRHPL